MTNPQLDEKPLDDTQHLEHVPNLNEDHDKAEHGTVAEALPLDPREDKRVRRKIDLVIMPVVCFIYTLNFVSALA